MKQASPVQMRKALEMVHALKVSGILFVPMPVLDDADGVALAKQMTDRLQKAAEEAENAQANT